MMMMKGAFRHGFGAMPGCDTKEGDREMGKE